MICGHTAFMKNRFIKCGICGWCLELLWTGLGSFRRRDKTLESRSSLWMFPIYGMAAFLGPMARLLKTCSVWIRGCVYMITIFCTEYLTGSFLKKRGCCPWDYSSSRFHVNGIIRLDYAPLWFLCGLLFEKLNRPSHS